MAQSLYFKRETFKLSFQQLYLGISAHVGSNYQNYNVGFCA